MNSYASDHEQWELIKAWWKANGKMIVTVVVIAMAATYGFRYWEQRQQQQAEHASVLFEQLLVSESRGSKAVTNAISLNLENHFTSTPYASLAAMIEARNAIAVNQLDIAEQKLTWAMEHSANKSLAQIARIRAARVLLAQNKPDAALTLLEKVDDDGFTAAINQAKANIYLQKGDKARALEFYQAALKTIPATQAIHELITTQEQQLPNSQ